MLARASSEASGVDVRLLDDYLSRNDAYTFFNTFDRLIVTGPTRTNVNDLRAILVLPRTP